MDQMKSSQTDQETPDSNDMLGTRKCALDMLTNILERKNALDITLDMNAEFPKFDPRDRNFVRMLVATTLRRLGQIDDLITFAQKRPDSLKAPVVRNILRIGIAQMFFMDVPDHASVDTSVQLTEAMGMAQQKSFVNAILRKLGREGARRLDNQDAARLNTPDWLLQIWINDYGLQGAGEIAQANMNKAPLDITVKDKDERAYFGNALQASELSTGTLRRINGGNVRELDGFDQGKWWVQDAAAAIPATLFGDIEGKHLIDMCAAPGGKTLQLASMGAHVTAIDRSAKRLKRLEENLKRMDLSTDTKIEIADAAAWRSAEPQHYILLDAPCSATGTIRRHPDNPHLKKPKDLEGLGTIQKRLLNHAGSLLAIDGVLIYCTCSLQKNEGEDQIAAFLAENPNFERRPISAEDVGNYSELINENGDLRILPNHLADQGGLDGFFVSRLIRIK